MGTFIKHYRNSFIDIQNESIRILMDPWLNTANEGSWAGSKNGKEYIFNSINKKNIDYIYISHLHTDHFDLDFLKELKKKQKRIFKIIIKKFADNRLKNQLIINGFKKNQIIDVLEFQSFNLSKTSKIIILPQISSSNTPSQYIKYDLDTSCVFIDSNVSLYNQVDNPYSLQDIKIIMKNLKKKINVKFDIAFIPYCAASEFPQSFININRMKEKKYIINKRLNKFLTIGKYLNCANVVPAGGSYHLDSIFSSLNKFLAIPSFNKINQIYKKNKIKKFSLINTKNHFFYAENNKISLKKNNFDNYFKSKIIKNKKNISYDKIKDKFSVKKIKDTLKILEKNIPVFKKRLYDKTDTKVKFCIWDKQPVVIKNIKHKIPLLKHEIKFSNKYKSTKLVIHVYYKLLIGIINRLVSWNEVQNHCLFERRPNKHDPDVVFWINLYKF